MLLLLLLLVLVVVVVVVVVVVMVVVVGVGPSCPPGAWVQTPSVLPCLGSAQMAVVASRYHRTDGCVLPYCPNVLLLAVLVVGILDVFFFFFIIFLGVGRGTVYF